ncbi:MAG: TRAP transporter substrate-binding protein [Burkholderiales bacterium]
MNKITGGLVAAMCALGLVVAAGPSAAADVKERNLKVAFVQMKDHPQGLSLERFAELVAKASDGKIKVRSFPGGQLGGDAAVIQSLQGGTIEMTLVATSLLGSQIKEYAMLDLPYLFNDFREADAVLDGPVGRKLNDKLPDKGLIGLSYWDHGFRNMTNSRRPIAKLEDFQGLKIRVLQLPLYVDMFTALGANAVPMPYPELYSAMETKAVDGQENTFSSIETAKFYEVQKFVSTTRHVYQPLILLFSKKVWDQLSADERKILLDAAAQTQPYNRTLSREADAKSLETLRTKGLQVTEFPPSSVAQIRERLRPVVDKYSRDAGEALVKEMMSEIEKARGRR